MEFRVFLTGGEPSERSAALIRGLSDLRVISGGYAVLKLEAVDGGSVPGLVSPQEAAAAVLPGAAFKGCEYSPGRLPWRICRRAGRIKAARYGIPGPDTGR